MAKPLNLLQVRSNNSAQCNKPLNKQGKRQPKTPVVQISNIEQAVVDSVWEVYSLDNMPENFRPIEFKTARKQLVQGYKVPNGFITDTPYFVNESLRIYGHIQWRYIAGCTDLKNCPNEFPRCSICKLHTKR